MDAGWWSTKIVETRIVVRRKEDAVVDGIAGGLGLKQDIGRFLAEDPGQTLGVSAFESWAMVGYCCFGYCLSIRRFVNGFKSIPG